MIPAGIAEVLPAMAVTAITGTAAGLSGEREQRQAQPRKQDAEPLAPAQLKAEEALRDHRQQHNSAREHRLNE